MSGVEFSLGPFFNLYNEATAIDILKKSETGSALKGANIEVTAEDRNFAFSDENLSLGMDAEKVSVEKKWIVFKTGTTATTIQGLPDGVYYIEEKEAPEGYEKAPKCTVTITDGVATGVFGPSSAPSSIDSTFVPATENSNATVTLVDTFDDSIGSLVISKTISGAPLDELGTISIDVDSKDSNAKPVSVPDLKVANVGTIVGKDWIDEGNGKYTFTIDGLPENVTYDVSEDLDGHNITYAIVSNPNRESTEIVGKDIKTVEFSNQYEKNTSKLVVFKEFNGLVGDLEPEDEKFDELMFTISTEIDGKTYYVKPVFKSQIGKYDCILSTDPTGLYYGAFYNNGTKNLIEFDEVPYGTYSIKEENGSVTGYTLNKTEVVNGDSTEETNTTSVTLNDAAGKEVTFRNTYAAETGSIKITKTIEGPVTENDLKNIEFAVNDGSTDVWTGKLGDTSKFTKGTDGNYVAAISDLDIKKTYTVTETSFDVSGRDVEVSYKIGATGTTKSGNTATNIIIAANDTTEVFFTDAYQKITGNLLITVEEEGVGRRIPNAVVSVTTKKTVGTTETKDYTTDANGQILITALPVEDEYSYKVTKIPARFILASAGEEKNIVIKANEATKKTVLIRKNYVSTPTAKQKPTARKLVENTKMQELITAPKYIPNGCKAIEYSTDGGKSWSKKIPVGKKAGKYVIKVRYVGDNDHFTIEGETLTVKIKAADKVHVNETFIVAGSTYKVSRIATAKVNGEVAFIKSNNAKSIVIPQTIRLKDKKSYKVRTIGPKAFTGKKIKKVTVGANVDSIKPRAFSGSKTKTIILKTKKLKKAKVKGCLKGSKVKVIKIKVGSKKMNKKFKKKYSKIFKKKNVGKKVKVRN